MKKKMKTIWSRAAPALRRCFGRAVKTLILYLDDLLLLSAGACFVAAAAEQYGRSAALTVAGVCLSVYAIILARARKGGGR